MTSKVPEVLHQDRPFTITPSPRYFYLAPQYRVVLNHLISTVMEREGLAIVAGPIGCGKSTMMRYLIDWLTEALLDKLTLAVIYNPNFTTEFGFIKAVCHEFNVPTRLNQVAQMDELRQFFAAENEAGRTVVLIVDEAHKLKGPQLEFIRELFNFASHDRFYVQALLFGEAQPLKNRLKHKQAILDRAMYYDEVKPLSFDETFELIKYRLRVAGMPETAFDSSAVLRIFQAAGGDLSNSNTGASPRKVIKLCRHVFGEAQASGNERITGEAVDLVLDQQPNLIAS